MPSHGQMNKVRAHLYGDPTPSYIEIRSQIFNCASGSHRNAFLLWQNFDLVAKLAKFSEGAVCAVQFQISRAENDVRVGWLP